MQLRAESWREAAGGGREGMKGCLVAAFLLIESQFPGVPLIRRDKAEPRTLNTQARPPREFISATSPMASFALWISFVNAGVSLLSY